MSMCRRFILGICALTINETYAGICMYHEIHLLTNTTYNNMREYINVLT